MQTDHFPEETLHIYLDGELNATDHQVVETHVLQCQACAHKLDEIRVLFAAMESVPEQGLDRDLAPAVLETIQPSGFPWAAGRWLVGFQIGIALIVLSYSWPRLLARLTPLAWQPLAESLAAQSALLAIQLAQTQQDILFAAQRFWDDLFRLLETGPGLAVPAISIWPWVAALGFLWLAINGLLLRTGSGNERSSRL